MSSKRRWTVHCLITSLCLLQATFGVTSEPATTESSDSTGHTLEGKLTLDAIDLEVVEHHREVWLNPILDYLPTMEIEFISDEGYLIPLNRGLLTTEHPQFDYLVSTGRNWFEEEAGIVRASLPFTLIHRDVNCTHNGVIEFTVVGADVNHMQVLVNQETCHFVQFDMQGAVQHFSFEPKEYPNKHEVASQYRLERKARIPVRRLDELENETGASASKLLAALPEDHGLSILGVYFNGVHYTTDCITRAASYPHCDEMLFTSFSTAKSLFPPLVLMRLAEELGVDVYRAKVAEYVPEVTSSAGNWEDVTLDHLQDMTSGNFEIDSPMADASPSNFYANLSKADKLAAALTWKNGSRAGSKFIYQTADTFILVTALERLMDDLALETTDPYTYLVDEIMKPLHLSPELMSTRRTTEQGVFNSGAAYGGFGMWFNRDGIVRLAKFLSIDRGQIKGRQLLQRSVLDETLQWENAPNGVPTDFFGFHYNNGMWALPVHRVSPDHFECEVWIPFMSGLSGVRVMLMPNDTIIYYFNDTRSFPTFEAVEFANQLKPFCET